MLFNCGRADKGDEEAVFAHLLSCGVPRLMQRYNVRCLDSWGDSSLGPRCPKVGGPWELSFEKLKSLGSQVRERKWQTRQNCRNREAVTRLIWGSIRSAVEGEGGKRARFQPRCQEGI